jgi:phosphohistidine phosphatase
VAAADPVTPRRVILLRHAKSSWDDADRDDVDRPLSARGERDAPRMGARLARLTPRPAAILTSHAVRARRTAQLVAEALGVDAGRIRIERALYLASPPDILAVLARQPAERTPLVVVGHNPGMTELANLLAADFEIDDLPTAAAVGLDFESADWSGLRAGQGRLAFYDYPKNEGPAVTPR